MNGVLVGIVLGLLLVAWAVTTFIGKESGGHDRVPFDSRNSSPSGDSTHRDDHDKPLI